MRFPRSCGTLLHPTSFPSKYGMGDLGPEARRFINFLQITGQTIWQVLPLGSTRSGYSPYNSYSAFAGNHYLISPEILKHKNLITSQEAERAERPVTCAAEFEVSYRAKDVLFRLAYERFQQSGSGEEQKLEEFRKTNSYWLQDYCLFIAAFKANEELPWNLWDDGLRRRNEKKMDLFRREHAGEIEYQTWLQYEFYSQWKALKEYANSRGIRIVGDIPIFVDHNSADVWVHSSSFKLDERGNPVAVSGVPPDYFSETGQLWGNPVYNWEKMKHNGFSWWVERFRQMLVLYDAVRVDHFRGFDEYWEVPAGSETARSGAWKAGPRSVFFSVLKKELGKIPIIAEDLGFITPGVEALRDEFAFPGMKVLHFAFNSDSQNDFLPHNYSQNCVVYTGTHDNNTSIGWYNSAQEVEKHRMRTYTRSNGYDVQWELIRLAMFSVADQAIIPLQDFMNLGAEHRMNTPGTTENNWRWRYTSEMLQNTNAGRIREMVEMSNRAFQASQAE